MSGPVGDQEKRPPEDAPAVAPEDAPAVAPGGSPAVAPGARLPRRGGAMDRFMENPSSMRLAIVAISVAMAASVVLAGLAMWLLDRQHYPDLGTALWWAVQTVTTVGYGDVTPADPVGRAIGALVMLEAVAFVAVVTATITSILLEARQAARRADRDDDEAAHRERLEGQLGDLLARLGSIEARLAAAAGDAGDPAGHQRG